MDFPYIISSDGDDLVGHIAARRDRISEDLRSSGAVLLRGFNVGGLDGFEAAVRALSGEPLAYTERSSPRSKIKGHVYTSTDYPPSEEIFFHNENSYQASWPKTIFFYCVRAPQDRGATPVSDIRKVLKAIDPSVRERFDRRGWMVVRNFNDNVGLPWREVFGTGERDEVMKYCAANDIRAEWREDNGLRTTSVRQAVHRHPETGEEVWFNHAAFFHLSTLPEEVQEGLREFFPDEDFPSNTYFGDGEPIADDVMEHVRSCYRDASARFDYHEGDVLVVDNMLAAHAREPFTPPREIVVAMAEPVRLDSLAHH